MRDRADFESGTILFNAYADLGSWYGITPYVGAGIGVSGNRFTNISREAFVLGAPVGAAVLSPRTTYNLAWALMAGVAIDTGVGFWSTSDTATSASATSARASTRPVRASRPTRSTRTRSASARAI